MHNKSTLAYFKTCFAAS